MFPTLSAETLYTRSTTSSGTPCPGPQPISRSLLLDLRLLTFYLGARPLVVTSAGLCPRLILYPKPNRRAFPVPGMPTIITGILHSTPMMTAKTFSCFKNQCLTVGRNKATETDMSSQHIRLIKIVAAVCNQYATTGYTICCDTSLGLTAGS